MSKPHKKHTRSQLPKMLQQPAGQVLALLISSIVLGVALVLGAWVVQSPVLFASRAAGCLGGRLAFGATTCPTLSQQAQCGENGLLTNFKSCNGGRCVADAKTLVGMCKGGDQGGGSQGGGGGSQGGGSGQHFTPCSQSNVGPGESKCIDRTHLRSCYLTNDQKYVVQESDCAREIPRGKQGYCSNGKCY